MGTNERKRDPIEMLDRSHARLTEAMQALLEATTAIAAGTGTAADRETLDDVLHFLGRGAERHVADEEQSVFPRLRKHPETGALIERIAAEHRNHDDTIIALRGAIRHLPAGADTLATIAADLASQYEAHIELEDAELIPAMRRLLSAGELDEMLREMRERRGK